MKKFMLLLLLLIVGVVVMVKHLPWWASVLVLIAMFFGGKILLKKALENLLLAPFKMKGAVLDQARIQVHSIAVASAPAPKLQEGGDGEEEVSPESNDPKVSRYYQLDVTIFPRDTAGPFRGWEPGELSLVSYEAPADVAEQDDKDVCVIKQIEIEDEGEFKKDEGYKYEGPRRLKLLIGMIEDVRKLKFQYYFSQFGEVDLSGSTMSAKAA